MDNYTERPKKKKPLSKPTMSHIMVFIILVVYILIILSGLTLVAFCVKLGLMEVASTLFIALLSYSAVCGSATIVMYVTKAMKENELKISNDVYRMKLELAKEICKALADKTLSEQSIALIAYLTNDTNTKNENFLQTLLSNNISSYNPNFSINTDGLG